MEKIEIPNELSHLKVDARGYPIPFFVAYPNGVPDFRLLDSRKQAACLEKKLCGICGKKLPKDSLFFISGLMGFKNRMSSDPGMHRGCAEYSLKTCPHMYYQRAERRDSGIDNGQFGKDLMLLDKPKEIYLIKASKFKSVPHPTMKGSMLITYTPVSAEIYVYEDNKLKKAQDNGKAPGKTGKGRPAP